MERINGEVVLVGRGRRPGIPPELRDKVFERFFRGAGDRSGSSGLGLSIVRAVAQSHDGTVTLEEPLDGRGARFVVRFPARSLIQAPDPAADSPGRHARDHFTAARRLQPGRRGVRAADRGGARDHPLLRAALGRLRGGLDPRRDRAPRQDHPDLRPRRPARPGGDRHGAGQDRDRRDRRRPGRRHGRRGRGGPDRRLRPARAGPDRQHATRSRRSRRSRTAS